MTAQANCPRSARCYMVALPNRSRCMPGRMCAVLPAYCLPTASVLPVLTWSSSGRGLLISASSACNAVLGSDTAGMNKLRSNITHQFIPRVVCEARKQMLWPFSCACLWRSATPSAKTLPHHVHQCCTAMIAGPYRVQSWHNCSLHATLQRDRGNTL